MNMELPRSIDKILLDEAAILTRVDALAAEISRAYKDDDNLVLIGVLKGAFMFLADLSRRLKVRHHIEFMALSSYPDAEKRSGAVRLIMDTRIDLAGRHALIVEDIFDTGHTLDYLTRMIRAREPASLRTCVLLRKPERQEVDLKIDYLGFDIPNVWVVGYGLDWGDRFRTLPYIAALKREQ
jgi:hypoxanthine phosphoribosyltransferase